MYMAGEAKAPVQAMARAIHPAAGAGAQRVHAKTTSGAVSRKGVIPVLYGSAVQKMTAQIASSTPIEVPAGRSARLQ